MVNKIEQYFLGFTKVLDSLATLVLFAVMMVVVLNILMRVLFNTPIYGTYEIVSYGSLIMAVCSLAACEMQNGNISVPILLERISKKANRILAIFTTTISAVGFAIVTWKMFEYGMKKQALGEVTGDLRIPLSIFAFVSTIGLALLTLTLIVKLISETVKPANLSDYDKDDLIEGSF